MPLPIALLGFISPLKKFLTPKNIAIAVGVLAIGYFVWSYQSMKGEIVELKVQLQTQKDETVKANAAVDRCVVAAANAAESYQNHIKEITARNEKKLNSLQEICTRTDRVDNLNEALDNAPSVEKPQEVLDLEKSLNDRLNNRGVQ